MRILVRVGELLVNPMMVKELRGGTRGARFFLVQLVVLLLFATSILIAFAAFAAQMAGREESVDPTLVGRGVYMISQLIQLGVVFLIVPAFAAGAITHERERQTYDILMSTGLGPFQIAWGKFSAALTMVGLLFVSLIPLVALTFLFGGVTFRQLVANYAFLFVLSALLCAWALSVSSSVNSTQRAVIGAYAGTLLAGLLLCLATPLMEANGVLHHYLAAYGYAGSAEEIRTGWRRAVAFDTYQTMLYVYAAPLVLAALLMGLFFLRSIINLSPPFADLALLPRLYYLLAVTVLLGLAYASMAHDFSSAYVDERTGFLGGLASALLMTGTISTLFACESAVPPTHVRAKYASLPPGRRWLHLLAPGALAGTRFCLLANVILLAGAALLFRPFTDGMNRGAWAGKLGFLPFLSALGTILPWIFALSGFGALLTTLLPRWPNLPKVIIAVTAGTLTVFPVIHWAIWMAFDRRVITPGQVVLGPWSLALSPVIALWSAILPHESHDEFPRHVDLGTPVSVHLVYTIAFTASGIVLHLLAARRVRRLREAATR